MTEKDRPRKKDWKREYEKSKEPERYREDIETGSFGFTYRSQTKHLIHKYAQKNDKDMM